MLGVQFTRIPLWKSGDGYVDKLDLAELCLRYGISGTWLLTGKGKMIEGRGFEKEIKRQIEGLKKARATSSGNNRKRYDVQISILEKKSAYGDYVNEGHTIESAAHDADEWLNGDRKEDLF